MPSGAATVPLSWQPSHVGAAEERTCARRRRKKCQKVTREGQASSPSPSSFTLWLASRMPMPTIEAPRRQACGWPSPAAASVGRGLLQP